MTPVCYEYLKYTPLLLFCTTPYIYGDIIGRLLSLTSNSYCLISANIPFEFQT